MKVSVLVPTYRRSHDLARCLQALKRQTSPADELLVVVRDTDEETHRFLRGFEADNVPLKIVDVTVPGQVAALNAGLAVAMGEIIAITDDDAAPHTDWLERIEAHFLADNRVGGVGGRDFIYVNDILQDASVYPGASNTVGKLEWCGRAIGNHHIGFGAAREVDILKGANMSYRRAAIESLQFSDALKGSGAQVCNDMGFSLTVKSHGWKLLYDPQVAVDHFPSERFDEDQRSAFNSIAQQNMAHNETLVLLKYLPSFRKVIYFAWALLVGTRTVPGVVQVFRFLPTQKQLSIQRGFASFQGRMSGISTWFNRSEVQ